MGSFIRFVGSYVASKPLVVDTDCNNLISITVQTHPYRLFFPVGSTHMQTHDFCAVIDLSRVLRHTVVCSRCGVIEKYTTKELMKTELSWECELCAQS
jgi:hypothetical protein